VNAEDHSTWNNASPSALLPFVSAVFRYGATLPAWRPLDDEILAIETDAPGKDPTIWRFAHHRSDVSYDGTPANVSFWYEPRPNISHDGGWVLFTSNWEKTLGTDAGGDSGAKARQDVFLVQLATAPVGDPTPVPAPVPTPTPVPLPTLASVITLLQQALKDVQAIHKSGVK
jgi:hypothetical protein